MVVSDHASIANKASSPGCQATVCNKEHLNYAVVQSSSLNTLTAPGVCSDIVKQ